MREIEKFVETTDNWHPNYQGNQVKVNMFYHADDGWLRICVWGMDDFGLEMDFEGTPKECREKYYEWRDDIYNKIPEPCTKDYFRKLGFYNA